MTKNQERDLFASFINQARQEALSSYILPLLEALQPYFHGVLDSDFPGEMALDQLKTTISARHDELSDVEQEICKKRAELERLKTDLKMSNIDLARAERAKGRLKEEMKQFFEELC